jgi:hypothetical protein
MVMPTEYYTLHINDIEINKYTMVQKPYGGILVEGSCVVALIHNQSFTMSFSYKGKYHDTKENLLEYLHHQAWEEYKKRYYKEPETLIEFCKRKIKKEG